MTDSPPSPPHTGRSDLLPDLFVLVREHVEEPVEELRQVREQVDVGQRVEDRDPACGGARGAAASHAARQQQRMASTERGAVRVHGPTKLNV
jgi:hypothetical protein